MFISNAYAQAASSEGFSLGSMGSFLPLLLMFAALYFLMIRPQQKKQKEQRNMLNALAEGDEVVTSGGIVGRIVRVAENFLELEISPGVYIIIQRAAVSSMLPKGSIDSIFLEEEIKKAESEIAAEKAALPAEAKTEEKGPTETR